MKLLIFPFLALLTACSGSSGGIGGTTYAGPGSDYRIEISGLTARIQELDSGLDVSGSVATLATGFSRMTVTTVTNTGGSAITVGDAADMLVIPGLVTLLKPILPGSTQIITAVPVGTCPTSNFSLNWIATKLTDPSTEDLYGAFNYTASTDTGQVTGFLVSNATAVPDIDNSLTPIGCVGGVATPTGAKMYLTSSGGAIVKLFQGAGDADDRFAVALPATTVVSGDLDGTYSGIIFDEQSGATYAAKAVINAATVSVDSINAGTDVADGAITDTITIADFNYNSIGVIQGTLTGTEEIRCITNTNINGSGKNFLFCTGQSPGGLATDVFTAMFISR